jgi:hypothetical protein
MLLLALALGLLALALAAGTEPRQAGPGPAPPREPLRAGDPVARRTLSAAAPGRQVVTVREGQAVELTVKADRLDTVSIPALDRVVPVEPLTPARVDFLAREPGRLEVRLLGADRTVGAVVVLPAG